MGAISYLSPPFIPLVHALSHRSDAVASHGERVQLVKVPVSDATWIDGGVGTAIAAGVHGSSPRHSCGARVGVAC